VTPPRPGMTGFHVRLPSALLARVDRQGERRMYSRNALVRLALEAALERWEDVSDHLENEAMEGRTG
jgi:metal-responsive CopG/Arc/MetJ family transcriptional regulator